MARLNYLELPVGDVAGHKRFYAEAFGWSFTDYGPSYAATTTGDVDIGLQGDASEHSAQLLPVIEVDDIDAAQARIETAGGTVTLPIFAFPGGRRFHFRDPHGHELAVMQPG
ncbi:VOC family protein [Sphingomonas baiyangensis]|uniref:VOC family protein n=1 Tax=Sphingomonas baiyangensis TaxID=2572576 RepID=A0A4U1L4C8_9SPHN|nr:VOC family protein [Sphingomonas baiyangensis]TKD51016.1 VOC family protein [Sphingomonas baiyangensis]